MHKKNIIKGSAWRIYALWSLFFCLTWACSGNGGMGNAEKKSDKLAVAFAEIRQMDSCRIKAKNRDFYLHKYKAEKIISDLQSYSRLSHADRKSLTKAISDLAFARTDYLMQVGKYREARKVMEDLASNTTLNLYSDTTQWLNFLYHQGKVHYHPYYINRYKKSILQGYDCIVQAYILSSRTDYPLYKALSMQMLSVYLLNDSIFNLASEFDRASIRYVNEDNVPDSLLAGNLAERALGIFLKFNDAYLTAEAWRNLARCYFKLGDAQRSADCLFMAIANPATDSMPDLRASINEQLSLSFAALNNKHNSDYYRNAYLDLQDSTRQDRELEARVVALKESTTRLWYLVAAAFAVFILLCVITITLTHIRRRKEKNATEEGEMLEQLSEELQTRRLQLSDALRSAVEQRARLSIVNGMMPLIDRMKIAIHKGNLEYATELADEIDKQNALLTKWIKLRKGIIQPKIETFALQDILNIIAKNSSLLNRQNIALDIPPTTISVKADHTLTLFIINTLVDNARKAIGNHGIITVLCTENTESGYAEISVADTGAGMTDTQVAHLFEYKVIQDNAATPSHGFGLVNCRGIIDRYRKLSSVFSVCTIMAKSTLGSGTTISFRLPLVAKTMLLTLLCCLASTTFATGNSTNGMTHNDSIAAAYCDSLYTCNIEGRYEQAMAYADSCHAIVKRDSTIDIGIRLSLYNETAVAALALHEWNKYTFYNYLFTNLYKEYTADSTLASYCQTMERNEQKANIAMLVVLLLIVALVPIFWLTYLRHLIKFRKGIRDKRQRLKEETRKVKQEYEHLHIVNNITDNQLSALKHETMYYPVRIRQLIASNQDAADLAATVDYYRDLYSLLSIQALNKQTSTFSFRIEKLCIDDIFPGIAVPQPMEDIKLTANKELMDYFKVLLRRHNGGKSPSCAVSQCSEKYVTIDFVMAGNSMLNPSANSLFSTTTPNVDFLVMRQIVRETGNSTMRYGAGITASVQNGVTIISVTLPGGVSGLVV